jgi:hypothetical protein
MTDLDRIKEVVDRVRPILGDLVLNWDAVLKGESPYIDLMYDEETFRSIGGTYGEDGKPYYWNGPSKKPFPYSNPLLDELNEAIMPTIKPTDHYRRA